MTTIFIRTFMVYAILITAMRIMGKRQIGELEVSELVTTLMLSEIASMPIENQQFPVMYAVIPIITLLFVEVFSSVILIKVPLLKNLVSAKPSILIRNGKIDQKELKKTRVSLEELMSELRAGNCIDPTNVSYAILEKNGKLTVIPMASETPPTSSELGVKAQESGMMHSLIIDGVICENNLKTSGKSERWFKNQMDEFPCPINEIYFFGADDGGKTVLIRKEKKAGKK